MRLAAFEAGNALFFAALGGAGTVLPAYLRDLGWSEEGIGLATAVAFLFALLFRPLSGIGVSKAQRATVVSASAAAALAALAYMDPDLVLVGRVLHGYALGMFIPATIAMATARGPEAVAVRSFAVGLGMALGPLASTVIYDVAGPHAALVSMALIQLVAIVLLVNTPVVHVESSRGDLNRHVITFTALIALYSAVVTAASTFIPVRLRDEGLPVTLFGAYHSTAILASLAPRLAVARIGASGRLAAAATAAAGLGIAGATTASTLAEFLVWGIVSGLGMGLLIPSYQILALRGRGGLAAAVYSSGWDVGSLVSPIVVGTAISTAGYWVLTALPLLLSVNVAALTVQEVVDAEVNIRGVAKDLRSN